MSTKDPQSGNDHIAIPEVYKSLARACLALRFLQNFTWNFPQHAFDVRRVAFLESRVLTLISTDEGSSHQPKKN